MNLSPSKGHRTPTLEKACRDLLTSTGGQILSIARISSNQEDEELTGGPKSPDRRPLSGDIDLVFVVKEKTPELKKWIQEAFTPYGLVVHHPDFYSSRPSDRKVFEIIVLPRDSNFFCSYRRGILTGLSVFGEGRYRTLAGRAIERVLRLPERFQGTLRERLMVYRQCDYGLNFMLTALWPYLLEPRWPFDLRRIARILVMDSLWVQTGVWVFDREETRSRLPGLLRDEQLLDFVHHVLWGKSDKREPATEESVTRLYRLVQHLNAQLGSLAMEENSE